MKTSYPQCVVTTVSRAISLVTLAVAGLSGCGLNITNPALFNGASTGTVNPVTPVTPAAPVVEGPASIPLKGYVGGEQWSVSGASVQLYAMGTQGSGSPATALLSQPVVTDNNGNFVIDQSYTCPSSSSQLYLTATGGTTGQVSGSSNQAIRLITLIGPCSGVSATAIYPVNEVTTIGAIWPLKAYIASITQFGMSNTDSQFASAETMVSELVNLQNATSPGSGVPDGYAVQSQKLNTIADDLHACVVTTGGSAGDGTACGQLFSLTSAPGAASPVDTFQAALQLAQSPQQNAAGLLQLGSSSTAFQPVLLEPPADWNLDLVQIPGAPLIQPATGTYPAGQQITMSASSTSAEIHYTLDGSTPTESSSVYEGPLVLTTAETVKAAVIAKEISGQVASSSYSITAPHLVFTAQPSSINSGAAFSPVVTISVVDGSGKLMQSSIPVSLTLMGGGGSSNLNGVTSVTAASGVASFSGLSVSGSGDGYSLLASSPGVASVSSGIFSVTASQTQTASLAFSLPNGSVNVGDSMAGTITLSKAAAAGGVKVQVSASPQTTLSITPSTVMIPAGQTTGSLVLTGLAQGTAVLTASSAGAVSGTAQMIVNPAPDKATHLVFTTQPSNLASGAVFSPTVSVSTVDDSGKVVSSSALITLSLNGANGSLSGQASSAARNGVANFPGLGESVAGDGYTLTATSPGLISATSSGFNVAAAVPEVPQISLAVPSQSIHVGDTLTGKIMLSKPAGVDGIRVQVSTTSPNIVSVTPVSVIIGAGQTAGVISCNGLSAGSTTLVASATGSNIASATVTVMAATPSIPHLVFTTQPTDTAAGATLAPAPTISIVDDSGNLVSSSNAQVTLTLASANGSTASLTGTSTLNASNGVAVFSTLSVATSWIGIYAYCNQYWSWFDRQQLIQCDTSRVSKPDTRISDNLKQPGSS